MKTAVVAGATGLVGNQLLKLLLDDERYSCVKAISRQPLPIQHPRLKNLVLSQDELEKFVPELQADDVFCCLGTTIKIAKTKKAFRKVDFDYPVALAKFTHKMGARQYLLVSALGANKKSSVFYNRVKGEVEEAIRAIGFETVHIVRPSLLLGNRNEQRPGEGAATAFFKMFGFLIPIKYKAIDALKVARAMNSLAHENKSGIYVHESKELQRF